MAVSEAQKKSAQKWDAANLDRVSIAMPKGTKDIIKAHAESRGESVNGFINRAIDLVMDGAAIQNAAGAPENSRNILTPSALKTAQEAAQRAGETISAFVERAIETQAQRDRLLQGMKTRNKEG